jgi:hypothetical protein
MPWKSHPVAELTGHPIEFSIKCGCTRVLTARAEYFLERFGSDATIEQAERRMKCRTCEQRPTITMHLQWGVSEGRDRRVNPPPLPEWVREGLG